MRPLKENLYRAALWSMSAANLPRLTANRYSGIGAILSLHRVHQVESELHFGTRHLSITPENFRRMIMGLVERGYDFVTMSEVERRLHGDAPSTRKFVCLTFDDGFEDTYSQAFQICRWLRIPMVVYVATGALKRSFPMMWGIGLERLVLKNKEIQFRWNGTTQFLPAASVADKRRAFFLMVERFAAARPEEIRKASEEMRVRYGISFMELTEQHAITPAMVREMHASGLVEFGAHGISHVNLRLLDAAEARHEIAESRRDLEQVVGEEICHFAYPYGKADAAGPREYAMCRELGLRTAVSSQMGNIVPADRGRPHALPRLTLSGGYQDTSLLDLLLSGTLPRLATVLQK
jgi:peptidoglycan/xylan/chitin deacetylase (PgdA/CDA1 family)